MTEQELSGAERRAIRAIMAAKLDHWESQYISINKGITKRISARAWRRYKAALIRRERWWIDEVRA